jgi:predicted RNA binding protein YcfA (HicA-like mRNA interferase family)
MTRFPALEGKDVVAVLKEHGFAEERQRGSHLFLKHVDGRATIVPLHAGETIGPGLFAKILRDVELSREEFLKDVKGRRKKL